MSVLAGKVAIITGASRGIGRSIARTFGAAGAAVVLTARTVDALEGLAAEITAGGGAALAVPGDLAQSGQIQPIVSAALARFGRVDILVNNAAIIHPRLHLVDFSPDLWRQVMEVNLNAAAFLIQAVLPTMMAQGSGKIINISSIGGRRGGAGRSAYRVTKAALISLTESVAAEVREHGIDVNCICPGGVETEGFREAFGVGREENPRLMLPDEIARVALFLASDAGSAITGTAVDAFGSSNPLFG